MLTRNHKLEILLVGRSYPRGSCSCEHELRGVAVTQNLTSCIKELFSRSIDGSNQNNLHNNAERERERGMRREIERVREREGVRERFRRDRYLGEIDI